MLPIVAKHADIKFATFDILLCDGSRADALMDEGNPFGQFLVAIHQGLLGDADGGIFTQTFNDQRILQARGTSHLAAKRKNGKGRNRNAVIAEKFFGQILAARQHQAARITSRIGNSHQFEITRDILIVRGLAMKFFKQVEDDIGLEGFDLVPYGAQFVLHAEHAHFMSRGAQCLDDIVTSFPGQSFLIAISPRRRGRLLLRVQEHQNSKLFHNANHCLRAGP